MPPLFYSKKGYAELLIAMVHRELKLRYKFTKLGFYWMILNPILQMLIMGLIFQFLMQTKITNYFVFLYIGIVIWNYFSNTISKSTNFIINERSLIQKSNFPRELIIFSTVIVNLVYLLISIFLLMILLISVRLGNYLYWLLLPLGIVDLFLMTTGFSFIFSTINVKHRDMDLIILAILPLWFYGTPILYELSMLPRTLSWLLYINPLTSVIEIFRYIFLGTPFFSYKGIILGSLIGIMLFSFGFSYFKKNSLTFNDYI